MVRSTQFAAAYVDSTLGHLLYTVPAGYVALLKSVSARLRAGGPATLQLYVKPVGLAYTPAVALFSGVAASTPQYAELWIVLEAGDTINALDSVGDSTWIVSGALLELP